MADYYARQSGGDDPFNWIKIHPLMTAETIAEYPFDHAGEGETSLMMAMCPDAVDMQSFSAERWYAETAARATAETGIRGRDLILAHMRKVLGLA
jgi:creatinine amidohydrolase